MIVSENKICSFPIFSHEVKNTSVGGGRGVKVRGGVGKACFVKKQPWPSSANSLGMWPKRRLGDRKPCLKKRSREHPKYGLVTQTLLSPPMTGLKSRRWRSMSLVPEEDQRSGRNQHTACNEECFMTMGCPRQAGTHHVIMEVTHREAIGWLSTLGRTLNDPWPGPPTSLQY